MRLGSGPGISPADAALQAARVAQARGVAIAKITVLLRDHITGRSLGIFGEPRVNVLSLNLALDEKYPKSSASRRLTHQIPCIAADETAAPLTLVTPAALRRKASDTVP